MSIFFIIGAELGGDCAYELVVYNINKTANNSQDYFVSIYLSHYNTSPFKEKLAEMPFPFSYKS
jgi:hypothetical protein